MSQIGSVSIKVLFLCSQNKRRSLTAEKLFDNRETIIARSAGTETHARVKVTSGLLGWADIIFCMEKKLNFQMMVYQMNPNL